MSQKRARRTCEICGNKEAHLENRLFFANFPLDEDRCRKWVQATGNSDLVHLPIEKLHTIKHNICGLHFKIKDFNKKGNCLKKRAVPSLNISSTPLSDYEMSDFPLYMFESQEETLEQPAEVQFSDSAVPTDDAEETLERPAEVQFSWEQDSAVPTDDAERCISPMDESFLPVDDITDSHRDVPSSPTEDHGAYHCNICSSEILHFRYTCVQCADFDLCGACEARQAHATHYVLRIPGPRPHGEVSAMLRTIRRALLSDAIVLVGDDHDLNFEVKDELDLEDPINVDASANTESTIEPDESIACSVTVESEFESIEQELEELQDDLSEEVEMLDDNNLVESEQGDMQHYSEQRHVERNIDKTSQPTIQLPASTKQSSIVGPSGLTSTQHMTREVRVLINPMKMPPPIPKIDNELQKGQLLTRLHEKRPRSLEQTSASPRILEQTSALPRVLEQTCASPRILEETSALPRILEQTSASPRILERTSASPRILEQTSAVPRILEQTSGPPRINTTTVNKSTILKSKSIRTSDTNMNPEGIQVLPKSIPDKRLMDQSTATKECSKKMRIKEIQLLPVPDDIVQQLRRKAQVSLQKLSSHSATQHKTNDSDSN